MDDEAGVKFNRITMNTIPLRVRGFTLIELMIVVAIVAILASLAYPSYSEYSERARRNDAKAVLLEASQYMERKFTETRKYSDVIALPTSLSKSPREGDIWFNLSVTTTDTSYSLTAAPKSGWTPKKCGSLILDQLGRKTVSSTTDSVQECWNK